MAPGRRGARSKPGSRARETQGSSSPFRGRASGRRAPPKKADADAPGDDGTPAVYREMLSELEPGSRPGSTSQQHAVKRRRIGERSRSRAVDLFGSGSERERANRRETVACSVENAQDTRVQTVFDVDASDDDDEGMEWEDVAVQAGPVYPGASAIEMRESSADEPLQITLDKNDAKGKRKATVQRRKPVTGAEKRMRLDFHKAHVVCLLGHVAMRNRWCNDEDVHKSLKRLLSKQTIIHLNPNPEGDQFRCSTTFASGLKQAVEIFSRRFKVTAPGMRRAYYREDTQEKGVPTLPDDIEILQSIKDFRTQATALQGSRDLGAQLFCAMLRAVGVETRLICSLQVLPFSGVAKGETPKTQGKEYIVMSESEGAISSADTQANKPVTRNISTPARGLGRPQFKSRSTASSRPSSRSGHPALMTESPHPIYWVEAFNAAMQKWVPVNPLDPNSIRKPSRMEPPLADRFNCMSYVVAFEDDLSARDVTRRYATSFNAKTRRHRVESTKNGEKWWDRTMKFFERPFLEDRDQVEIAELTAKTAGETMPKNVQDFKDHPIYVLERHLRRNEVIHPKRAIGKAGLSKAAPAKNAQPLESVYRRDDVHVVKSADGWYRLGRSVKAGEQPLKRVRAPRNKVTMNDLFGDDSEGDNVQETPMYAEFQTDLYEPPPVADGIVPKNNYGNIDVYVESMVPKGGFHLKHQDASLAAKILGISFADAVTGFQFKGRHGTAVTNGIVAAEEYREALHVVLQGLQDERAQEEEARRTKAALRMWKLLLTRLRVMERIDSYTFEGDDVKAKDPAALASEMDDVEGGDFLPEGGGFVPEGGGFVPEGGCVTEQEAALPQSPSDFPARQKSEINDTPPVADDEQVGNNPEFGHDFVHGLSTAHQRANQASGMPESTSIPKRTGKTSRYNLVVIPNADGPADSRLPLENLSSAVESRSCAEPVTEETGTSSATAAANLAALVEELAAPSGEQSTNTPARAQDSESDWDYGSMLSEDPEDEDAIPDWLASDDER